MESGRRWTACLISCLFLTGCATNDLVIKRQTESEAKIEHLIQSAKSNELGMNELSDQIQILEALSKDTSVQIKRLQDSMRELRSSQDELKARMILLSKQASTPKVEVVNQEATLKTKDIGPPADYLKAFGLYSANNFAEAVVAFEAFMKSNPQSDFSANALYWIGECHYSLNDLVKAKEVFFRVAGTYPNSTKAPDALLKLGYTLSALKEKEKANSIFESLIKSHPSSPAAVKARERLTAN